MSKDVFLPDGSKRIVIPDDKLQEFLNNGWLDKAGWQELCKQKAAADYQVWLNNPDTVQERFQMLRQARDAKISATDYLMTADYPISTESKSAIVVYRQTLRNLPAQAGAPWDGGGSLTPWPAMPTITKTSN